MIAQVLVTPSWTPARRLEKTQLHQHVDFFLPKTEQLNICRVFEKCSKKRRFIRLVKDLYLLSRSTLPAATRFGALAAMLGRKNWEGSKLDLR